MAQVLHVDAVTRLLRRLIRSIRYGFWGGVDWQMGKMPADFVISPKGIILKAHYGRDMGDHLSIAEVEAVLADLNIPHQS